MKILVLQHIPIEDPGYIKVLMQQDQYELTTIELDAGEKIPNNLAEFDAMLCMGGPMDTWMEAEYPWLIEEKIKIKEFVCDLEKPFLGFCLGAQLLGEVLGGKVVKSNPPEIGVLDIHLQLQAKCSEQNGICFIRLFLLPFFGARAFLEKFGKKLQVHQNS